MVRRSGARDFKFDIDTGVGSFLPAKAKPVDLSEIEEVVKESGFELLWLEAQVRGTLQSARDPSGTVRPAVQVKETGQVFLLIEGTTEQEREGHGRLKEWLDGPSRTVSVRGRVHGHVDSPPGLTVKEFRLDDEGR